MVVRVDPCGSRWKVQVPGSWPEREGMIDAFSIDVFGDANHSWFEIGCSSLDQEEPSDWLVEVMIVMIISESFGNEQDVGHHQ